VTPGLIKLYERPMRWPLVEEILLSGRGRPIRVLRPSMPKVDEMLLDSVVYVYPSMEDAKQGVAYGGSGFLVTIELKNEPGFGFIYAVTNKHVIRKGSTVVRVNTHDGYTDQFPFTRDDWQLHPTADLAVAQLMSLDSEFHRTCQFEANQIVSKDICGKLQIGAGDEVYMLGRFISHDGKQRNQPFVQSGIISLMPTDVVTATDDDDNPTETEELFLIEMRSLSGCSGSPVLFQFPLTASTSPRLTPDNRDLLRQRWLLGIDCGHFKTHEDVKLDTHARGQERYLSTQYVAESNAGQMMVVPAWKLQELLDHPRFARLREQGERESFRRIQNRMLTEDVGKIG
jgi:hypothetical protein